MRTRATKVALWVWLLSLVAGCAQGAPSPATGDSPTSASPTREAASPSAPATAPSEAATSETAEPTRQGTKVIARESDYGTILFDGTGQAIYIFDVETTTEARCYRECAEAWPPVLTDGAPRAGKGVRASLLGTTERNDGSTQVTYGGQPLYLYAHEGRHEVKCHDIFLNGGNWYAVQPDGRRAP